MVLNGFAIVVLVALVAETLLNALADALNLRALRPELPAGLPHEVREAWDAERYRRSQEYTRAVTRFQLVPSLVELALVLGFWAAGGFPWLDARVRSAGFGPVGTGLLFIGALFLARGVVMLPFKLYGTFVIEERFGFNRTTPRTFVADQLKSLALLLVLGTPILAAILWFFGRAGGQAWLWCWLVTAAFVLVVQLVAPAWILPLFLKFERLPDGDLRQRILGFAQRVNFPLEDLYVVDGSRRSSKTNAFFTGIGKNKRVALFDTLVDKHAPEEIEAIVAHEVGHQKRGHVTRGLWLGILQAGAVFWVMGRVMQSDGLYAAFGLDARTAYAGLVFFSLLWAPVDLVLRTILLWISRRHEFEADRFALETTGSGVALARALAKLGADNLSNLTPHRLHVVLHHSHPPLQERIRALRAG